MRVELIGWKEGIEWHYEIAFRLEFLEEFFRNFLLKSLFKIFLQFFLIFFLQFLLNLKQKINFNLKFNIFLFPSKKFSISTFNLPNLLQYSIKAFHNQKLTFKVLAHTNISKYIFNISLKASKNLIFPPLMFFFTFSAPIYFCNIHIMSPKENVFLHISCWLIKREEI